VSTAPAVPELARRNWASRATVARTSTEQLLYRRCWIDQGFASPETEDVRRSFPGLMLASTGIETKQPKSLPGSLRLSRRSR
jgi:hypothetical protein